MIGRVVIFGEDVPQSMQRDICMEHLPQPSRFARLRRLWARSIHPLVHSWMDTIYIERPGARPINMPRVCWVCLEDTGTLVFEG